MEAAALAVGAAHSFHRMPTQKEVRERAPAMMRQSAADKALREAMEAAKRLDRDDALAVNDALAALSVARNEHEKYASHAVLDEVQRMGDELAVLLLRCMPKEAQPSFSAQASSEKTGVPSASKQTGKLRATSAVFVPSGAPTFGDQGRRAAADKALSDAADAAKKLSPSEAIMALNKALTEHQEHATFNTRGQALNQRDELARMLAASKATSSAFPAASSSTAPAVADASTTSERPIPKVLQLSGGKYQPDFGVYHLEPGRLVCGSPVWKKAADTVRIARLPGCRDWAVQLPDSVGSSSAHLVLQSSHVLLYPCDRTDGFWEQPDAADNVWVPCPLLMCSDATGWPAAPAVLQLRGDMQGTGAGCAGVYHLTDRTVHNSPCWKQSHGNRFIARMIPYGHWAVRNEIDSESGTSCHLAISAPELLYPCDPTIARWQAFVFGKWTTLPQVRCSDESPPAVLQLSGGGKRGPKRGIFILEAGRTVNSSPVWKKAGGLECIARVSAGGNWGVQHQDDVGKPAPDGTRCFMVLRAPELLRPCGDTTKAWQIWVDGKWADQPEVRCSDMRTRPPPPEVLQLWGTGGELLQRRAKFGFYHLSVDRKVLYHLEGDRKVHDSPVWKQAGGTCRIARMSPQGNWGVQSAEHVGRSSSSAFLILRAPELLHPCDKTSEQWAVADDQNGWLTAHDVDCADVGPPPEVVIIKTGTLKSRGLNGLPVGACRGVYRLNKDDYDNRGVTVWEHITAPYSIYADEGHRWVVDQNRKGYDGGMGVPALMMSDEKLAYPSVATSAMWKVLGPDSKWHPEPEVRCVGMQRPRFAIGTHVEASVREGYASGVVIEHFYRYDAHAHGLSDQLPHACSSCDRPCYAERTTLIQSSSRHTGSGWRKELRRVASRSMQGRTATCLSGLLEAETPTAARSMW